MSAPAQTEQHGLTEHSHGGWGVVPVQTRTERFTSVDPTEFPEVTGFEAEWKLTPVSKVRHLIDGELDGSTYTVDSTKAAGTQLDWIARDDALVGSVGIPEDKASANAWASFDKALHIRLSGDAEPLTVTRSALGTTARGAHTVITADKGSTGLVVLDNRGDAQLTENLEIAVGDDANITVVSVQEWNTGAAHLTTQFATVGRGATLKHIVVSLGGDVVRVNPTVRLAGEGADGEMFGVYFADAGQHLEQRPFMHHEAAHTRGRVTYKGALNGEGARTVWVGDVLIGRNATGTDSYEQNRNLVLSDGTRADSIPNLEIETGDIAGAGHASATGRFDDEQLFYLQARGVPEDEARRLVVLGFLSEIVQQIGDAALEQRLIEALEAELVASA